MKIRKRITCLEFAKKYIILENYWYLGKTLEDTKKQYEYVMSGEESELYEI